MFLKPRHLLYLCFLLLGTLACQSSSGEQQQETVVPTVPQLRFESVSFQKKWGPCTEDETADKCLNVDLNYHQAVDGSPKIREAINQQIAAYLRESLLDSENSTSSIDSAAAQLGRTYLQSLREDPEFTIMWAAEVNGELNEIDSFAVFDMNNYTFFGGAHPNTFKRILNIHLPSGKEWRYDDFVTDTTAFQKLVAGGLNAEVDQINQAVGGDAMLHMDDMFWGEGFSLPANFGLEADSIYFYYNPYEAAAYVFGPFDFKLPKSAMQGITKF